MCFGNDLYVYFRYLLNSNFYSPYLTDSSKSSKIIEKENQPLSESCDNVSVSATFLTCGSHLVSAAVSTSSVTLSQIKPEPMTIFNRNPTHPLLHINTLYEDRDELIITNSSPDPADIISVIPPKQVMLTPFEEPRAIINSVDY